jgi:hypothetical protein
MGIGPHICVTMMKRNFFPLSLRTRAISSGSFPLSTNATPAVWPSIHQIYFEENQVPYLDEDFIPYRNVANPRPEWCEYFVFRTEYLAGTCGHGLTGFVSWKFGQKTGLSGGDFCSWIAEHPGYDVYFVNPFPNLVRKRFRNVWHQGSICHPAILPIAQLLFDKVGYQVNLKAIEMDERVTAYCNYWAATPEFWRRYIEFCEPLYNVIESGLTSDEKARILARADAVSTCCYIPYIFERLFSTLLCIDPDIRSLRMPLPSNTSGKLAEPPLYKKIAREIYRPFKPLSKKIAREIYRPFKRMKERRAGKFRAAS